MNNNNDLLAIEFQESEDPKACNKNFKQLRKIYLPWIYSKFQEFSPRDCEELLAIYDQNILRALTLWNREALFTTYLYPWVRKAFYETRRLYPIRDKKYTSLNAYQDFTDEWD